MTGRSSHLVASPRWAPALKIDHRIQWKTVRPTTTGRRWSSHLSLGTPDKVQMPMCLFKQLLLLSIPRPRIQGRHFIGSFINRFHSLDFFQDVQFKWQLSGYLRANFSVERAGKWNIQNEEKSNSKWKGKRRSICQRKRTQFDRFPIFQNLNQILILNEKLKMNFSTAKKRRKLEPADKLACTQLETSWSQM